MKAIVAIALALAAPYSCVTSWFGLGSETKDRLSPEAMERMVEVPMAAVREHGLDRGRAAFEDLRRAEAARGGAVEVADLHMAFGVELYMEFLDREDPALLRASREYVHASIAYYRAAFGPDHPEVAVALHSFAAVEARLNDERLTPAAQAALVEAIRIRRAALGPENAETRAAERRLASLRNPKGSDAPAGAAGRALEEAERQIREGR